jgi:uncharacterized damage-inducible protein DinB
MSRFIVVLLALFLLPAHALAQGQAEKKLKPAAGSAQAEALINFDSAAGKILQLAEAVPAEKYSWRPGEGVRSFSEVFLHVAGGNFGIPRAFGTPRPDGLPAPAGFDKTTSAKPEVIALLTRSIEHVRGAMGKVESKDLDVAIPFFGDNEWTKRETMFFLASHNHEHLGQLIAYSRMNGIVPPWSVSND